MHEIAVKIKYEPIRFKMNLLTEDFMLPFRKFQFNKISITSKNVNNEKPSRAPNEPPKLDNKPTKVILGVRGTKI